MQTVDASRAVCASYGFQPGSDAFAQCVMTEQHRHTLLIYGGGAGGPAPAVPQTGFGQPVISSEDVSAPSLPRNSRTGRADSNLSRPDGRGFSAPGQCFEPAKRSE
jgi:hypothetical protein